jgi:hypothetical protein
LNSREHFLLGFMVSMGYMLLSWSRMDIWLVLKTLCLWWLFSCAADDDKKFDIPHRNWFFHSLLPPTIFVSCFFFLDPGVCLLIHGSHLILDLSQRMGKKPIGTYLIHLWKGKRLSKNRTRLWLFDNFCACVALFFVLEVF